MHYIFNRAAFEFDGACQMQEWFGPYKIEEIRNHVSADGVRGSFEIVARDLYDRDIFITSKREYRLEDKFSDDPAWQSQTSFELSPKAQAKKNEFRRNIVNFKVSDPNLTKEDIERNLQKIEALFEKINSNK